MRYIRETATVVMSDTELSSYAQSKLNIPLSKQSGGFDPFELSEFPCEPLDTAGSCSFTSASGEYSVYVNTYPDLICMAGDILTVVVSSAQNRIYQRFNVSANAELLARGVACARGACERFGADAVRLVIKTVSRQTGESCAFRRDFTKEAVVKLTDALLNRASVMIGVFVQRNSVRLDEIKKLSFPYKGIREGQHELMIGVMRILRRGGKLLASAPTGTGKTMATLYPSVKALGEGFVDRIFYLTGKTVTGKAAFDSMKLLAESVPSLRCIMIHSKERSCAVRNNEDGCFACQRMNPAELGGELLSYKSRRDAALDELLCEHTMFNAKIISECAEKYIICPYELSLDVSEFCDTVICDYNYVFDNAVRFKRYFKEDRNEKYVFLIDECHNLPDRVRASYSGIIESSQLDALEDVACSRLSSDTELIQAIRAMKDVLEDIKSACLENGRIVTDRTGDHTVGYYKADTAPSALTYTSAVLGKACRRAAKECEECSDILKNAADTFSSVSNAVAAENEGFAFLAELFDGGVKASVVCLDPSAIIAGMTECAHSTVMFSATLNPIDYFADMLGCGDAPVIKAESPFDKRNLSVTVFDGISTKLSDRKNTARDVAEVIATVLEAKEGHYFIFFPSYAYMKSVAKELLAICPDIKAVMQKQNMSYSDREKFLAAFKSRKFKSIVGLCVLGGVFSEGVDLAGDGLIGVIVVGAGLPGISSELNLMSEYFEEKYGRGRLYAYEYPAINRIEQASGRVIRTDTDRGVIVLVDDRLSSPEMADRCPDFWPQIACTSDVDTLSVILDRFWSSFDNLV